MPVFVLGMHRSGTSAITRLVNLLGLALSRDDDVVKDKPDNPTGHWESRNLYSVNNALLLMLGGHWCLPPKPADRWWLDANLASLLAQCREQFQRVYEPSGRWVWKDPRNCLLLRFWMHALQCEPVIVFIHRHPLEVHASLEKRNSFTLEQSAALWEVYNAAALRQSRGLPVFSCSYETLLAAPVDLMGRLGRFFARHGVIAENFQVDETAVSRFISGELRHTTYGPADVEAAPLTPEQKKLYSYLQSIPEESDTFSDDALPPESKQSPLHSLRHLLGPVLLTLKKTLDHQLAQLEQLRPR